MPEGRFLMRRSRFGTAFLLCLSVLGIDMAQAAPAAKWVLTLPDGGTYSYWVQAKSGAVSALPTTVMHKTTETLTGQIATGDTLCVLDAHTGEIAVRPLAAPGPIVLTVGDFKPLPVQAAVVPSAPVPILAAAPPPHDAPNGIALLFTWVLGLAVAAAVGWFIWKLVQTRGEPLLALARRVGVDVPDPKPIDPNAEAPLPLYEAPKPRALERVPDDAGVAPPPPRSGPAPRKLGPPTGTPQLVGTQGLAGGTTFALTDEIVTVGRDGDNGIVLAENTVSRRHAQLTRDSQGHFLIADEGSANGIYVNGERVPQATLEHGDEVKIGDNYFRFEA
jgi:hypothetical protein